MTANVKLAERLEAFRKLDAFRKDNFRTHCENPKCTNRDCVTDRELESIILALRSPSPAQGAVLPEAITNELIIKSRFGLMVRGFNGMGFDARLGDVLTDVQLTPQAALDALAKQLDAGGRRQWTETCSLPS